MFHMTYLIHSQDPNCGSHDLFNTFRGSKLWIPRLIQDTPRIPLLISWLIQCTPGIQIADPVTYSIHAWDPTFGSRYLFDTLGSALPSLQKFCVTIRSDMSNLCSHHVVLCGARWPLFRKMKTFTSLGPSLIFTLGCSRSISRNSGLLADVIRHLPDGVHHKLFCTFQVGTNSVVF
jgi:hypothetical protein